MDSHYSINLNIYFLFFWIATGFTIFLLYKAKNNGLFSSKEIWTIVAASIILGFVDVLPQEEVFYIIRGYMPENIVFIITSLTNTIVRIFPFVILIYILNKLRNSPPNIQIDTDEVINKVFNQGKFLNTLGTSLPVGANDTTLGLDYIPFMLQSVEERRKRFKQTSFIWLLATALLGLIFIIAVFYYSNLLLNDKSSGTPKLVNELKIELQRTNDIIKDEYGIKNEDFYTKEGIDIIYLTNINKSLTEQSKDSISQFINKFKKNLNLKIFVNELEEHYELIVKEVPKERNKLREEINRINSYINSKEYNLKNLPRTISKIENLTNSLVSSTEQPQNMLDELIKRILLSVVVVSFILTLLRFVARQYKSNYNEMIKAEKEDLFIRKLYVGLKNAGTDNDVNKLVISSLLNTNIESGGNLDNISEQEMNILKNTIDTILSKFS